MVIPLHLQSDMAEWYSQLRPVFSWQLVAQLHINHQVAYTLVKSVVFRPL